MLHLDARSTLWRHQRERFASHPSGRLTLIEQPLKVLWGHYSQVDCQRPLLRAALAEPFDYVHLISGADWPACPLPQIARDIAAYGERRPVFTDLWGELQLNRMDDWWFEHPKINLTDVLRLNENIARAQVRASWALTRWGKKLGLKRSTYEGQPWMKGSSWYSVPQDAARVLLAEYDRLMGEGGCASRNAPTSMSRLPSSPGILLIASNRRAATSTGAATPPPQAAARAGRRRHPPEWRMVRPQMRCAGG